MTPELVIGFLAVAWLSAFGVTDAAAAIRRRRPAPAPRTTRIGLAPASPRRPSTRKESAA